MVYLLVTIAAFVGTLLAMTVLWRLRGGRVAAEDAARTAAMADAAQQAMIEALIQIRGELHGDHGTSLRDVVNRIEESGGRVEAAAVVVAEDLAAAHDRADAAHGGIAGEAADAASRSPE